MTITNAQVDAAVRDYCASVEASHEAHPTTADLRSYALGLLARADAELVDEHILLCRPCMAKVRALRPSRNGGGPIEHHEESRGGLR